jgi:hypothetical protein
MGFRSGLWTEQESPFLETYCPQTIPSQILLYGREHSHADTDVITEMAFHRRQYAMAQNVLVSSCIYISVQYYERAKSIP